MLRVISHGRTASRTLSYMLGLTVILLAISVIFTAKPLPEVTDWLRDVLGYSFLGLTGILVFVVFFCWIKLISEEKENFEVWMISGIQAANGIMTLALTFTLLGISLGIASLSGKALTPETVQPAIQEMTTNFSLAFMTTVIGLPLSAILRGLLIITDAKQRKIDRSSIKESR
ncbi:MAG: hypothetical protein CMM53_06710 [Rhodospirillaceae bacterium]|nr:hypothetical protein [Rhodospirillaceae bacterium]|tara:strand:+ start:167 stop:685 length:519 start_codon:yes stop_codon:yes gene_type:complete